MTRTIEHEAASATATGASVPHVPNILALAQKARQLRSIMSACLPRHMFVDPAWDMMLDLLIATEQGESLHVKDLVILSGEAPASAMRRIQRLQQADLLCRHPDPDDHRRVRVRLTMKGYNSMAAMLKGLFDLRTDASPDQNPVSFSPNPFYY